MAHYTNISAMRQQLPADVRVHGIITKGGEAPNIIPDRAEGLYYVRSASKVYLNDILMHRFEDCLKGAASAAARQGSWLSFWPGKKGK